MRQPNTRSTVHFTKYPINNSLLSVYSKYILCTYNMDIIGTTVSCFVLGGTSNGPEVAAYQRCPLIEVSRYTYALNEMHENSCVLTCSGPHKRLRN